MTSGNESTSMAPRSFRPSGGWVIVAPTLLTGFDSAILAPNSVMSGSVIKLERGAHLADYVSATVRDGKEGIGTYCLKRFILQNSQLTKRLDDHCRAGPAVFSIL